MGIIMVIALVCLIACGVLFYHDLFLGWDNIVELMKGRSKTIREWLNSNYHGNNAAGLEEDSIPRELIDGYLEYIDESKTRAKANLRGKILECVCGSAILFSVLMGIGLIVYGIIMMNSYSSYVDAKSFHDGVVEQYRSAVVMYEGKAVLDIKKAAITDIRYNGYQEGMAKMILDLRFRIARYNQTVISKKIMVNNWWYSWLIIGPGDLKPITLVEN